MSWDITNGYQDIYLHLDMHDFFFFLATTDATIDALRSHLGGAGASSDFTKISRPLVQI